MGESDVHACGPPASFSSGVCPQIQGDNVGAYVDAVDEMCVECYRGGIVVMVVIWHQYCVNMILGRVVYLF